jgi:hypothetical protein
MGWVGDAYDNALYVSFFATLECALIGRTDLPTLAATERATLDYIEGWYHPRRGHSSLGYLSPAAFERAGNGELALAAAENSSAGPVPIPRRAGEGPASPGVGEAGSTRAFTGPPNRGRSTAMGEPTSRKLSLLTREA